VTRKFFALLLAVAGSASPVGPAATAAAAQTPAQRATADSVGAGALEPGVAPRPLTPEEARLEALTKEVASQLRCPVCQGLSIEDSPSSLGQSMRAVVRDQLAAGKTPEEVKAYFVDRYGEWILLAPEPHGFNLAVYLLPVGGVLAGAVALFFLIRKWAKPAADASVVPADEPDLAPWQP
jgi:cytochrome c-type biogenesis protein CcmH